MHYDMFSCASENAGWSTGPSVHHFALDWVIWQQAGCQIFVFQWEHWMNAIKWGTDRMNYNNSLPITITRSNC